MSPCVEGNNFLLGMTFQNTLSTTTTGHLQQGVVLRGAYICMSHVQTIDRWAIQREGGAGVTPEANGHGGKERYGVFCTNTAETVQQAKMHN